MTLLNLAIFGAFLIFCLWAGQMLITLVMLAIGGIVAGIGWLWERLKELSCKTRWGEGEQETKI